MQTFFADGVVNISMSPGPLVRFEFGVVSPVPSTDGTLEMKLTPSQQVVMPLDGFMRAFGVQRQVIDKLVVDGVIKLNEEVNPD